MFLILSVTENTVTENTVTENTKVEVVMHYSKKRRVSGLFASRSLLS
jgi:hypothetical protein